MMALYLFLPLSTLPTILVMAVCTLIALFLIRLEFEPSKLSTRSVVAVVIAVVIAVPLAAQPVYVWCDWDSILTSCNGSEICAWAIWLSNVCYW